MKQQKEFSDSSLDSSMQACRRLLWIAALFCTSGPVAADDASNCQQARPVVQIQACSTIIKTRRLSGQPIGDENLALAFLNRGYAYDKTGALDLAVADFTKAIALNPKLARAHYNRGLSLGRKGDATRAIEDYNRAIALRPDYAAAFNNRAIAYQFLKNFAQAEADYNKAIRLRPKYANAYNNRGDLFEKKGDTARAVADYRKALEIDPGHKAAQFNLRNLDAK